MHSSFAEPHDNAHHGRESDGGSDEYDSDDSDTMISTNGSARNNECTNTGTNTRKDPPGHNSRFQIELRRLSQNHGAAQFAPYSLVLYKSTPQRHSQVKLTLQKLKKEDERNDSGVESPVTPPSNRREGGHPDTHNGHMSSQDATTNRHHQDRDEHFHDGNDYDDDEDEGTDTDGDDTPS